MKFKERPPGVEEWDGYEYNLDGPRSEEEFYKQLEEYKDRVRKREEQQKANGTFSGISELDENGDIKWMSKVFSFHDCACCGKQLKLKVYCHEVCRNCGWKDDKKQAADPELRGESNEMSLNEAKRAFKNGEKIR